MLHIRCAAGVQGKDQFFCFIQSVDMSLLKVHDFGELGLKDELPRSLESRRDKRRPPDNSTQPARTSRRAGSSVLSSCSARL